MDGAAFVKQVQADEKLKKVPFIVICSESNQEVTAAVRQAGIADFIAKPFTEAMLKKKMTAVLGNF